MKNERRKVNKRLSELKIKALKLKDGGQLPSFLFLKIVHLGIDSDMELVKVYMTLSEIYLRVPNFYKKYPEYEKIYEEEVNKYLQERGLR